MRSVFTIVWLSFSPLASLAAAAEIQDRSQVAALVTQLQNGSNPAGASAAFVALRKALHTGTGEVRQAVQTQLQAALWTTQDAGAIRRISLVLSAAPSEADLLILVHRLDAGSAPAVSQALCSGIHAVAGGGTGWSAATAGLALQRLESICRNPRLPAPVIDSAIMATAAFESPGFDQLMRLRLDPTVPGKAQSVMFTALGETDDPRAVLVLREAVADPALGDARRAQAIHGLGQAFARASASNRPIDPAVRLISVAAMKSLLADGVPDRLFIAALQALGGMEDAREDSAVQQATMTALTSSVAGRRAAALEVLVRRGAALDLALTAIVRGLAESDVSPEVRSAAAGLLDLAEDAAGGAD